MEGRFPEVLETILFLSVLPTILCAFAFVYGLVFCIQSLINGEKMSESKHCRNMFLLAGGSLALLLLLPTPWLYQYESKPKGGGCYLRSAPPLCRLKEVF